MVIVVSIVGKYIYDVIVNLEIIMITEAGTSGGEQIK